MSNTLPLLGRRITLEQAQNADDNILHQLEYPRQRQDFFDHLSTHKAEIETIVCYHLGVKECRVRDAQTWLSGSFNVCIPVSIDPPSKVRSIFVRIPLPYKVGEENSPENVDEKLRCEVASYLWMQENCPDVTIPDLFGFGFPDGLNFTTPEQASFLLRSMWSIKRTLLSWFGYPIPSRYIKRRRQDTLRTGYLIIARVTKGRMLSDTFEEFRHDQTRRTNLFHSLSRISLSLNKTPLPSIGSLTFKNQGIITLTNRPLTLQLQSMENEGIPTMISRSATYSAVEPYFLDLLSCHDNRITFQPNAIHDADDGQQQLAALTMMHAVMHHFCPCDSRHGPFVFTLTDLHQSNIFVDDNWNITSLIDLEWACSLPLQFQCPPYWLSGRGIDQIEPGSDSFEEFQQLVGEFIDVFEREERALLGAGQKLQQAPMMRRCWESGAFWYFQALNSPKGLLSVFTEHIQRRFCPPHCEMAIFDQVVSPYWRVGAVDVIERKIEEESRYKERIKEYFESVAVLSEA
ncbi:hypothetical protein WAI453_002381 [Rhynchosporium graminicola]|uniref:Aminoglycoside phosphotransferase domain-containing protein n=1 Tax=Rhynchosporium graminicola TaxID=2792576 RepID=A0A1E1KRW8_9HELO|nr:uncharacterized protein RCO7_07962 [Rhynchosporium commune]